MRFALDRIAREKPAPTFSEAAAKDLRGLASLREAMRTGILPPPKPVSEVKRKRGLLCVSNSQFSG